MSSTEQCIEWVSVHKGAPASHHTLNYNVPFGRIARKEEENR